MPQNTATLKILVNADAKSAIANLDQITTAVNKANRSAGDSAEAAQRRQEAAAKRTADAQIRLTDNAAQYAYRTGEKSANDYIRFLDQRMAGDQRYSARWLALARERDRVDAAIQRQSQARMRSLGNFGTAASNVGRTLTSTVTFPLVAAGGYSLAKSLDFEKAFTEVKKFVEGSSAQLETLRKQLRAMALDRNVGTTFEKLSEIAAQGGQRGVGIENIASYTRAVAILGKTTDVTAEQGAEGLAKIRAAMQLPEAEFKAMASVLSAMNAAGASSSAQILEISERIGATAREIGLTFPQVAAFANVIASLGQEAEAGGTAFNQAAIKIARAVAENSKSLSLYAAVAGMTADTFRKKFQTDAFGAIQAFINGLAQIPARSGETIKVFDALGLKGVRLQVALRNLAAGHDLLVQAVDKANEAFDKQDDAEKRAAVAAQSHAAQLDQLKRQADDAAATLGERMLPAEAKVADKASELLTRFNRLSDGTKDFLIESAAGAAVGGPILSMAGALATTLVNVDKLAMALGGLKGLGRIGITIAIAYEAGNIPLIPSPKGEKNPDGSPKRVGLWEAIGDVHDVRTSAATSMERLRNAPLQRKAYEANYLAQQRAEVERFTAGRDITDRSLDRGLPDNILAIARRQFGPQEMSRYHQNDPGWAQALLGRLQEHLRTNAASAQSDYEGLLKKSQPAPATDLAARIVAAMSQGGNVDKIGAACANYVSNVLKKAGAGVEGSNVAKDLVANLLKHGAQKVDTAQRRPGDVAVYYGAGYGAMKDEAGKGFHVGVIGPGDTVHSGAGGKETARPFYGHPTILRLGAGAAGAAAAPNLANIDAITDSMSAQGKKAAADAERAKKKAAEEAKKAQEDLERSLTVAAERQAAASENEFQNMLKRFEKVGGTNAPALLGRLSTRLQQQETGAAQSKFEQQKGESPLTAEQERLTAVQKAQEAYAKRRQEIAEAGARFGKDLAERRKKLLDDENEKLNRRDERVKQALGDQKEAMQGQIDLTSELSDQEKLRERIFAIERQEAAIQRGLDLRQAKSAPERQAAEDRYSAALQVVDTAQAKAEREARQQGLQKEISLLESRLSLVAEASDKAGIQTEIDMKRQQLAETEDERAIARNDVLLRQRDEDRQRTQQQIDLLEAQAAATDDITRQNALLRQADDLRYSAAETNAQREIVLLENVLRQRQRISAEAEKNHEDLLKGAMGGANKDLTTTVLTGTLDPAKRSIDAFEVAYRNAKPEERMELVRQYLEELRTAEDASAKLGDKIPKDIFKGLRQDVLKLTQDPKFADQGAELSVKLNIAESARREIPQVFRDLEDGADRAGESLLHRLLGGGNRKQAFKGFFDELKGVGIESLSHWAITDVLKPEFGKLGTLLSGSLKGGVVELVSAAYELAALSGAMGQRKKKGGIWGSLLGGIIGFATGGVGAIIPGLLKGGAAGAFLASPDIGGALNLAGAFGALGGGGGSVSNPIPPGAAVGGLPNINPSVGSLPTRAALVPAIAAPAMPSLSSLSGSSSMAGGASIEAVAKRVGAEVAKVMGRPNVTYNHNGDNVGGQEVTRHDDSLIYKLDRELAL